MIKNLHLSPNQDLNRKGQLTLLLTVIHLLCDLLQTIMEEMVEAMETIIPMEMVKEMAMVRGVVMVKEMVMV